MHTNNLYFSVPCVRVCKPIHLSLCVLCLVPDIVVQTPHTQHNCFPVTFQQSVFKKKKMLSIWISLLIVACPPYLCSNELSAPQCEHNNEKHTLVKYTLRRY